MKKTTQQCSRREFIRQNTVIGAGVVLAAGASSSLLACSSAVDDEEASEEEEPIIDIHQHTNYHGRTDEETLAHQRAMGVTTTILLPAGSSVETEATHQGESNGLGGVDAGANESCYQFAENHADEYLFAANEVPGLPETIEEIETYLDRGGKLIGESKFGVDCDAPEMQEIYELAEAYDVPVLLHWQHGRYNHGFERFHEMLEKYPSVNFIGHAQTWWANIDADHEDQSNLYPEGSVTPGGLTDRLLSDYPNMYADMSAGSGLNALTRDEEHAVEFLERHQDKILYGSDCADAVGYGEECQGAQTIAAIRRLSSSKTVERKILHDNAKQLLKL